MLDVPLDVNECIQAALAGEDICSSPMFCVNTNGGYLCECPGGTENVAGKCVTGSVSLIYKRCIAAYYIQA